MPKEKTIEKKMGEGFGVTGLVLGILSLIFIWVFPPLGLIFGLFGIIFSAVQQVKSPTSLGKAALIICIIGFVVSIAVGVLYITTFFAIRESVMQKLAELQGMMGNSSLSDLHDLNQYKDLLDRIPHNLTN